ncbi:MAG: hypothetical protein V2I25_14955 [Woeseiaceae bacterium]|jgi:hypothetical protein|nr:hypothetical protein [Woeseiaceae bacterium]
MTQERKQGAGTKISILAAAATLLVSGTALAQPWYGSWGASTPQLRTDGAQVPGGCPIESPGGTFIFTARNPGTGLDIYVNQRAMAGAPYEPGAALPFPINDAAAGDFCPTPLPDNSLYFVSTRDGCGGADMFRAVQNPATGWTTPENLGCHPNGPNTPGTEFSPSVVETAWGTFLFYSTDYHTGNQDIYRSHMRADGTFGPGVRLPSPINTGYDDQQPNVSPDGREIVFASNRPSSDDDTSGFDIFYAKRAQPFIRWRRATNLSETVPFETVGAGETRPSLSWDGKRLVYGSGGVWLSERERR